MKGSRLIVLLLISSAPLIFPMHVSTQAQQPPKTAVPGFYQGLPSDQVALKRGEAVFMQRCSLCHLPRIRKHGDTPGPAPSLSGLNWSAPEQDNKVRDIIMKGSDRMPGWQYSLKPGQIDDVIKYLKTL